VRHSGACARQAHATLCHDEKGCVREGDLLGPRAITWRVKERDDMLIPSQKREMGPLGELPLLALNPAEVGACTLQLADGSLQATACSRSPCQDW
jgi:hypothetical protein